MYKWGQKVKYHNEVVQIVELDTGSILPYHIMNNSINKWVTDKDICRI